VYNLNYTQLWGYKVEEKLHLRVSEQKRDSIPLFNGEIAGSGSDANIMALQAAKRVVSRQARAASV
jgi:hypothetical protein